MASKNWTPTAPDGGRTCQHCKSRMVACPRGLCNICYYIPEVRSSYALKQKHYSMKPEEFQSDYVVIPTNHGPGSAGKIEVMAERFSARASLFHPLDATLGG